MDVPRSLRTWFFIHFVTDYVFAVPLFLFPVQSLGALGWPAADPVTTRLVAAALFAIGGISLLGRGAGADVYRHLLILKIMWSAGALLALSLELVAGDASQAVILAGALFALFASVWVYYYAKLRRER